MSLTWKFKRLLSSALTDLVLWSVWTLVVLAGLLLPLYLGTSYLLARDCHPHVNISVSQQFISGFNVSQLLQTVTAPAPSEATMNDNDTSLSSPSSSSSLVTSVLSTDLSLSVGADNVPVSAPVLPQHLLRSAGAMVTNIVGEYRVSDVGQYCSINNITEKGLVSLGLELCSAPLQSSLGPDTTAQLRQWVGDLGAETQASMVDSLMAGDLVTVLGLLPTMFPEAGK